MEADGAFAVATRLGYLHPDYTYPRGEVSDAAFCRLVELVKHSFTEWFGYHNCELDACGLYRYPTPLEYNGLIIDHQGGTEILVPGDAVLFAAPALILHYVKCHQYAPPADFLNAALACPQPGSR